jgi:dihydrofolate reductase
MRKIILSLNITNDHFIAGPDGSLDWHLPYWTNEMCDALGKLLDSCDTILLGRNTYNAFAAYWTIRRNDLTIPKADLALVDMMNRYTKVVVSKTLSRTPWSNSVLVQQNVFRELKKLKQQSGKSIIVLGSCQLAAYLIKQDLIDEYYLWLHPISIKHGKALPQLINLHVRAKVADIEEFSCGVIKRGYVKHTMSLQG